MNMLFIEYPKCSTCQKAKKYLLSQGVDVIARHIVEDTPTADELRNWWKKSGLPLRKFFNTSGNLYKELHMKDRLPQTSEEEMLQLLSEHGMLIKRPLLIFEDQVLIGFKEENYQKLCSND